MPPKTIPHTKRVKSRGKTYLYFRTGRKNAKGLEILIRLPPVGTAQFGDTYAGLMSARTKRGKEILTVPGLIERFMAGPKFLSLSGGSQKIYRIGFDKFAASFPTAPAGEIERQDIVALADQWAHRPGAVNTMLSAIQAMYKWARTRNLVDNEPTKDVDRNKLEEHQPWPQAVLDAALISTDRSVRLPVHLLYYTAQRIQDVVGMKWADIDRGYVAVVQQKTGKPMSIRLHKALAAELEQTPRRAGTIITTTYGKPASQQTVRENLQAFAKKQFGVDIVPHGLRKNAVNTLLEIGCSVAETAAISGQTLQLVEHYAKARSQKTLGDRAMRQWDGTDSELASAVENTANE